MRKNDAAIILKNYSYCITYRSAALVGLFVEFIEQEEEHNSMHANPPNKSFGIITVNEEQLEGMYHNGNKLYLNYRKKNKKKKDMKSLFPENHLKAK